MENQVWPAKYQQSVSTVLERTEDNLKNGNLKIDVEDGDCSKQTSEEDHKGFIKLEPCPDNNQHQSTVSEKSKQAVRSILEQIKSLSQIEKFLLYLKLPSEVSNPVDPFRQPLNPLGNRSEIYRTISWIKTHLEEDPDISLPKQEVYNGYFNYCEANQIKPLSQADFGKVMKQVYPKVRARRLGTRGNSRYCYSGLRRCVKLKPPVLPDLAEKSTRAEVPFTQSSLNSAAWLIVKEWSEKQLGHQFPSIQSLAYHLILNHSIGRGSEAASKFAYVAELSVKEENKGENKHREMQLQLQKKIQQKNEGKERKRKMQSSKSDHKPGGKKSRSQSLPVPSPSSLAVVSTTCSPTANLIGGGINGGESSNGPTSLSIVLNGSTAGGGMGGSGDCSSTNSSNGSTNSNSTSPTDVTPQSNNSRGIICDSKSMIMESSAQLPSLPDFNSFQRPTEGLLLGKSGQETNMSVATVSMVNNKIPIPRLQQQQSAPLFSSTNGGVPLLAPSGAACPPQLMSASATTKRPLVATVVVGNVTTAGGGGGGGIGGGAGVESTKPIKYKSPQQAQPGLRRNCDIASYNHPLSPLGITASAAAVASNARRRRAAYAQRGANRSQDFHRIKAKLLKSSCAMIGDNNNIDNDVIDVVDDDEDDDKTCDRLKKCDDDDYNNDDNDEDYESNVRDNDDATAGSVGTTTGGGNGDDEDDEVSDFPLTRERINSVSNVEKDAMDEYLGTNNSQHDEELSKYFGNSEINETTLDTDNTAKISTLRQLLQNGIVDPKPSVQNLLDSKVTPDRPTAFANPPSGLTSCTPVQTKIAYVTPCIEPINIANVPNNNTKRRVSFETSIVEEPVPPSPNTRRKNFSFTPISSGPQSPNNGIQSKCSSTTTSPFVSPRNTPVLRTKPSVHQNAGLKTPTVAKHKREIELSIEIPTEGQYQGTTAYGSTAMSAPPSPMLKKLLNSNCKVSYNPGYNVQNIPTTPDVSQEITRFFATSNMESGPIVTTIDTNRSQSAPAHQVALSSLDKTIPFPANMFASEQSSPINEFAEIDPIPEAETADNVKRLLNSLEEQSCDNNNIDLFNIDHNLNEFGLQLIDMAPSFATATSVTASDQFIPTRTMRSQSIDVGTTTAFERSSCNPSRSVPCTPIPFAHNVKLPSASSKASYGGSASRSYPSTPLTSTNEGDRFTYNTNNGDYLLNGQPIRSETIDPSYIPGLVINGEPVEPLGGRQAQETTQQQYGLIDGADATLIDDCVLIEQNYGGAID